MCITTHSQAPTTVRKAVVNELEFLLRSAINKCLQDGAKPSDVLHLYLSAEGMDFNFVFNPAGQHAVTIADILKDDGLHVILEQFARMIQSGKNVFIDDNTRLFVYTFSPPSGGGSKRFFCANKEEFLKKCRSIVEIKNPGTKICFSKAFILGLSHIADNQLEFKNYRSKDAKQWTARAIELHKALGLDVQQPVLWKHMEDAAKTFGVNVHLFDMSNITPGFSYHYPPQESSLRYEKNLYFLQDGDHFHYITNITAIIRDFKRNEHVEFCEMCFNIYDKRYVDIDVGHVCSNEPGEGDVREPVRPYVLGDRKLAYYPNEGEEKDTSEFMRRTEPKKKVDRPILYLDFETYIQGRNRNSETLVIEPPLHPDLLPSIIVGDDDPYAPYEYVPRQYNSEEYEYFQTVNYCEIQREDGEAFVFQDLASTMKWLSHKDRENSIVIAHCGGRFDFQFIFRDYLVNADIVRLKKTKAPLLKGNKIVSAHIHNDITLVDSYAFVTTALAKFPAIFNIEEEKKGFFPHSFNRPEFWHHVGPIPHSQYYEPDTFPPAKRMEFFKWYNDQVEKKVIFDFRREMQAYCHSDVQLLRIGMQKFRDMFLDLKDNEGRNIGVDPFNYLTIAGVAFGGIYTTYFLPENTICTVKRPTESNHSFKQILWLEYESSKVVDRFIQHARNAGEFEVTLDRGKKVKVDGYCQQTNTIYQFHGCFYHGCPYCYESSAPTPHRVSKYVNKQGKEVTTPIKFGQLHASTLVMTHNLRRLGYNVTEMWECQWDQIVKAKKINIKRPDLEHMKPLQPRDAYFGGRVNAAKLYYLCQGPEKIHYMDVTSMFPFVMSSPAYFYPVKEPTILVKGRDTLMPIDKVFGVMKVLIEAPDNLYFPVLPERSESGKCMYSLKTMTGTWSSVEIQKAVRVGYKVLDIYEQHHFNEKRNDLFRAYNETFFDIKRQAKVDGNKGLEAIAKLCINSPYGKWGYNPSKAKGSRIVTETDEFARYMFGIWNEVSINIINKDVALASVQETNEYTEHGKSNVYISTFVTAYARLKLYEEAMEPLGKLVLYFDTDSVVYVSPTGEHLIHPDTTGVMGLWTSETTADDWFTEFVSGGPKTYGLKSFSGRKDVVKAKGFSLHYANQQILNFESLKEQVLIKALTEDVVSLTDAQFSKKRRLTLHTDEIIMRRKFFDIAVENNRGKGLNLVYDKRKILNPMVSLEEVTMVDTLPFGHRDLALYHTRVTMMDIMNEDYAAEDDGGVEETKENMPMET